MGSALSKKWHYTRCSPFFNTGRKPFCCAMRPRARPKHALLIILMSQSLSFIPSISSTNDAGAEATRSLAAKLRVYYSFVAPAAVERAFEVAFIYRNDRQALNQALIAKYGKSLEAVTDIKGTVSVEEEESLPQESLETTFDYLMRAPVRTRTRLDDKIGLGNGDKVMSATVREGGEEATGFKRGAEAAVEDSDARSHTWQPSAHKQHSSSPPQRVFEVSRTLSAPSSGGVKTTISKGSQLASVPSSKREIENLSSADLIKVWQSQPLHKCLQDILGALQHLRLPVRLQQRVWTSYLRW